MLYLLMFERYAFQTNFMREMFKRFAFTVDDTDIGSLKVFSDNVIEIIREHFCKRGLIQPLDKDKVIVSFQCMILLYQTFYDISLFSLREKCFNFIQPKAVTAFSLLIQIKVSEDKMDIIVENRRIGNNRSEKSDFIDTAFKHFHDTH